MKIEFVTGKGGVGKSAVAAALALAYSKGFVTWNQVSEETGIGFGDLLVALGSQNLQLPKVVAKRTPTQDGFYRQILDAAKASQGLGQ
jgi:anion-transporting  ArsA/GET3 family ATPase